MIGLSLTHDYKNTLDWFIANKCWFVHFISAMVVPTHSKTPVSALVGIPTNRLPETDIATPGSLLRRHGETGSSLLYDLYGGTQFLSRGYPQLQGVTSDLVLLMLVFVKMGVPPTISSTNPQLFFGVPHGLRNSHHFWS